MSVSTAAVFTVLIICTLIGFVTWFTNQPMCLWALIFVPVILSWVTKNQETSTDNTESESE